MNLRSQLVLSLAIAAAVVSVLSAGEPMMLRAASQSGPPKAPQQFEPEVVRLRTEGLTLTDSLQVGSEGGVNLLAAIFKRNKPKDPSQTSEFRIIESDGGVPRSIFKRNDFFFSFDIGDSRKLNATDINKDGLKEIIVQSGSGGNCWACNPIEIYQVRDHKAELIAAAPIQKIADLDGDGSQELLVTDTRWESYDDFAHAASPGATMVYAWKGGRYVYASRDFVEFYKTETDRLRKLIAGEKANITTSSDDFYVGLAVGLTITYAHAGDAQRGLNELEQLLKMDTKTPEQMKHRKEILDDFRQGESSKKLREPRYGDPLPL